MNWEEAVDVVESRHSAHDPELLEAAKVLVAKVRKLNARKTRKITVGNVTLSITGWAARTGLNKSTIYTRISQGWTPEDAVSFPNQSDGSKFDGKTLREHSKASGLSIDCIYARLQRGWSVQDAVSKPKQVN